MGRKARFRKEDFIEAALELLAERGLAGVTMAAISKRTGAPVGSVYHRFKSREILLAELWVALIESFQEGFIAVLQSGATEKAALYTLKWIREHRHKARVFLLHHREQLIAGDWPDEMKEKVETLMNGLNDCLTDFARQHMGKATRQNLARIAFCLIHVPMSAARDYLESGRPVPTYYDKLVLETYRAVLKPHLKGV